VITMMDDAYGDDGHCADDEENCAHHDNGHCAN
jgi:hypothetical protein